jgi:hypothetical protein
MDRGEIITNPEYQRSDKVWPPAARSFLIETIMLGYPIPKIFLFQKLDLKSKTTVKEIVDGQQRTKTIHDFFHNRLQISVDSQIDEARGRTYDQMHPDSQGRFLTYQLSIDLFVSVAPAEIREAFRRLNSYTVPLNPEELRHAEYQGVFKWFIYRLTREFEETLLQLGVMTQKNIVRMQDTKLLAECTHTFLHGAKTTKAKDLTSLYKEFDKEFPDEAAIRSRLENAISFIVELPEIQNGPLMKPFIFYSLIIAVSHFQQPLASFESFIPASREPLQREIAVANLTTLAAALEAEAPEQHLLPFVRACSERTNVESQRRSRIEWLAKALQPTLL